MTAYGPGIALLVVDVQNDFADPGGSLYVSGAGEAVESANREIARAAAAGSPIVYSQDWHPPATPHFQKDGGVWPVHCVAGTWGAELHPRLVVAADHQLVRKGVSGEDGYSAFSVRDPAGGRSEGTGLDKVLRDAGVHEVVVVGLATDYCVKETALDAVRLGFRTTVLREAIRAVDLSAGDGDRAMAEVAAAGATVA